jgi:hypothetical protein
MKCWSAAQTIQGQQIQSLLSSSASSTLLLAVLKSTRSNPQFFSMWWNQQNSMPFPGSIKSMTTIVPLPTEPHSPQNRNSITGKWCRSTCGYTTQFAGYKTANCTPYHKKQGIQFKIQPNNNHVFCYKNEIRNKADPVKYSHNQSLTPPITLKSRSSSLVGCCSHQFHKHCAGVKEIRCTHEQNITVLSSYSVLPCWNTLLNASQTAAKDFSAK